MMPTCRTRSRNGCLTCRQHKRKCQGGPPRCRNCENANRECRWGMKISFHPSRELVLSNADSAVLLGLEEERRNKQSATQFVDNTEQIVREYSYATTFVDDIARNVRNFTISRSGIANNTTTAPECCEPSTLDNSNGGLLFKNISGLTAQISSHRDAIALTEFETELPITKSEQVQLIRAYLQETGTWCEVTDSNRHFTVSYAHKLMDNKPFAAAAMALASRQLDAVRRISRQSTLSLYQHAIQSLLHYEPSQCGEATLACCVLLSMYEMMTSEVPEWRRHLKGCVFNLTNKGWNGSSPALVGASFWAFARIDIWAAYLLGSETLIPPERWVDNDDVVSIAAIGTTEDYCNLATLLLARVLKYLAGNLQHPFATDSVNVLWFNLQAWHANRPRSVQHFLKTKPTLGIPFSHIVHIGDSSICGNSFYHAASMLLLRTGQVRQDQVDLETETHDPIWHAHELCGISITNASHASWINQVDSLFIAGQMFELVDEVGEEHAAEKVALLKHLTRIERETGWPTASKAAILRKAWGLE